MTQGGDTEQQEDGDATFTAPVRFTERGYGFSCSACGSLVVGADALATHRRHHQAMAAWWWRPENR